MFFRKKILTAKLESAYGQDSLPGASDAVLTKNLRIQPYTGPTVSRDTDRSTFGSESQINTAPGVQVTFEVELAGSGTLGEAPAWGQVLRACAFLETADAGVDVVYSPLSEEAAIPSATLKFYLDGQEHRIRGALGNVALQMNRGQLPVMAFTFMGLYDRPGAASLPAGDVSDYIAPVAMTKTNTPVFTVGGVSSVLESLSVDMGNNVVHRNLPGADRVRITDRRAAGQMVFEAPSIATKNWFADVESHSGVTLQPLNLVHGIEEGNVVTLAAPQLQLTSIDPQDSDGLVIYNMNALYIPQNGNDELTITLT